MQKSVVIQLVSSSHRNSCPKIHPRCALTANRRNIYRKNCASRALTASHRNSCQKNLDRCALAASHRTTAVNKRCVSCALTASERKTANRGFVNRKNKCTDVVRCFLRPQEARGNRGFICFRTEGFHNRSSQTIMNFDTGTGRHETTR